MGIEKFFEIVKPNPTPGIDGLRIGHAQSGPPYDSVYGKGAKQDHKRRDKKIGGV